MTRLFAGTQWDKPPSCDRCGELEEACHCPPPPRQFSQPGKQTARVAIEKRKAGKKVTVVRGLAEDETDLPELLSKLKTNCGAGGTVRDGLIEVQGEQLDRVKNYLISLGYKVKP